MRRTAKNKMRTVTLDSGSRIEITVQVGADSDSIADAIRALGEGLIDAAEQISNEPGP